MVLETPKLYFQSSYNVIWVVDVVFIKIALEQQSLACVYSAVSLIGVVLLFYESENIRKWIRLIEIWKYSIPIGDIRNSLE